MKTIWLTLVVLFLIGTGVFVYSSKQRSSGESVSPKNDIVEQDKASDDSRYIVYSKANLEDAKNTRRVLFFYANWCPTCRPADEAFSQNENKIPQGVTLIRVNYNDTETDQEENDLALQYGITYQHTFVQIDENGNVVTKWNGGQIDELLQNIK